METISFYSYKGGVGRTLALANIANYLLKMNLQVCVIDFDLEAPGLHYKLSEKSVISLEKGGIVDLIHDFYINQNAEISIKEYTIPIKQKSNKGNLFFIPAGNVISNEYWRKLSEINWPDLLYTKERYGLFFFLQLRELIKNELKPDYLLIDSRTGITEIGGICTALLADKVLFLLTNNQENVDGINNVSQAISKVPRFEGMKPIEKYYALTRIPKEIDDKVIENIASQIKDDKFTERLVKIYSDRELELAETVPLSQKQIDNRPLTTSYLDLFTKIVGIEQIEKHIDVLIESISNEEPANAIAELENLSKAILNTKIDEALLDICLKTNNKKNFVEAFNSYYKKMNMGVETKYIKDYIECILAQDVSLDLSIIENYINMKDKKDVKHTKLNLFYFYFRQKNYRRAKELSIELLDTNFKIDMFRNLFVIFNRTKDINLVNVFKEYEKDILEDYELQLLYCDFIYELKDTSTLIKIIDNTEFRTYLIEKEPYLSYNVFSEIFNDKIIFNIYDDLIDKYVMNSNVENLKFIGYLYKLFPTKFKSFKQKIKNHSKYKIVINEINKMKNELKLENGKIIYEKQPISLLELADFIKKRPFRF